MKEIWSGHEKLTDRQMDGQTDDQCLDIKLATPTSNALPICIIYFFNLLINAGKLCYDMKQCFITSIAAAAGGSRRHLPKAGVERSSYVGIAYTISVKLSN